MACDYRIILVLDGGADALLVPIVGLNYLANRTDYFEANNDFLRWIDVLVASGDSVLLAALLAENKSSLLHRTLEAERLYEQQNKGFSVGLADHFFEENMQLGQLKKHYSFMSYDVESDEPFIFSSTKPTLQNVSLNDVLKACIGNPLENQFVKLYNRKLANASTFIPSPIFQASNFANCLYHDDPLVFVSIGAGRAKEATNDDKLVESQHELFEKEIKSKRKWHYFRFNPCFSEDAGLDTKLAEIRAYFEHEAPNLDRLIRLMELKAGRIL